jgi:ABC-2 type transport system ATP-binding protein
MIEVSGLRKSYHEFEAVKGVSFQARPGEIFGLLGPNGAGKTTTIHCICGLIRPTGGAIRVLGHDAASQAARAQLGIVPQEAALYEDLTALENLMYWGGAQRLRGASLKSRVREALELVGLQDRAREPVKRFSGGMKRRLNFACGIVHQPRALLLDEPIVGVDPQSRVRLLELVRDQARQGACVLYTTHHMEEAEQLCHRMAVMDHGRLIAQGTLDQLRAELNERDLLRLTGVFDPEKSRAALLPLHDIEIHQCDPETILVSMKDAPARLSPVLSTLSAAGADIRGTILKQPSLESLFVKLTGKELRDGA